MSNSTPLAALKALHEAGYDPQNNPQNKERVQQVQALLERAAADPNKVVVDYLRATREAEHAKQQCAKAAEAAGELEGLLKGLLEANFTLCRMDKLLRTGPRPMVICQVGGQLQQLPIHPDVALDELDQVMPWDYVCVHPKERMVVGVWREDPELFARAQGEVVEFQGYHDEQQGLVRVSRQGHEEQVVALAPNLRERALTPEDNLVLQRDRPHWAINTIAQQRPQSKFEVPLDQIHTRLEDLAGMDQVVEQLVVDILLRLVHPDIRRQFDLAPLRGMLLWSYKPGMGKTALLRAITVWLQELGDQLGFDVVLYVVKPNELKIVWHGGDGRLVRDELCGSIRARQAVPRDRPLFQFVVFDEIDSLGKRSGGDDGQAVHSSAQNDAVQALLVEMDGMIQDQPAGDSPPAHVLWCGLTNRPDMLDEALKRPGRFGDLVMEIPDYDRHSAEKVMAIYARSAGVPWYDGDEVRDDLSVEEIRERFLGPALARIFPAVVLRYATDSQRSIDVTAGELFAGVHYKDALNSAKKRAATRRLLGTGVPAIGFEDVLEGLLTQAQSAAKQMAADRMMLLRQLRIKIPVTRVELVPDEDLAVHRLLRVAS